MLSGTKCSNCLLCVQIVRSRNQDGVDARIGNERVEILSGVTAADKVIATPFDSLVSGMTVRVATISESPQPPNVTPNKP